MFAESLIAVFGLLALQDTTTTPAGFSATLPVAQYVAEQPGAPMKKSVDDLGVEITADEGVVVDVESGSVLMKKNADAPHSIASLTKLVTAMVVLDAKAPLEEEVTLIAEDEPSGLKTAFGRGERLSVDELLDSLLIGSDNESANALARSHGGTETFVRLMNRKAAELGMTQAHFFDPSGLDARNRASALDVALAVRAAMGYERIRKATEHSSITIVGRATQKPYTIKTTNLLLGSALNKDDYHIVLGKTGSLPEAKFCLAQVTQRKDGHGVIAVVLGSETHFDRFDDVKALTYWAFKAYDWPAQAIVQQP